MPPRDNADFSAPSGFGEPSTFAGPSSFRALTENDPDLSEGGWTKPKKKESEGLTEAQNLASIEKRKALIATYGTSDKDKVAQLMSLGVFEKDAGTRYKLDPEGFKTNVQEALRILGRDGINATPDGEELRTREYREGTGQSGEPYFTNLSNRELGNQQNQRRGTEAHADEGKHSVNDLHKIGLQDAAPGTRKPELTNEQLMFEGKLDRATDRAMKDERDMEHTGKLAAYSDELIDYGRKAGGTKARERLNQELMDGTLLKKDINGKEAIILNRILEKRIRTAKEIHTKRLDPSFFIPDVVRGPLPDSDPTQPSSFANPEGSPSPQAITTYEHLQADNKQQQVLSDAAAKEQELPRTAQYATGKKAPKPPPRSVIAEGGKAGGLFEDIEGFLAGEGRHGSGESGAGGMAKDLASFYGPRLPGDIATAVGGVGAKRAAGAVGKKMLGIRAIENMLGKF